VVKKVSRGGRREYRALVARTIEPKELGLAGAVQVARVDRRIGAKAQLHQTWLVASRSSRQLSEAGWLGLEQQRWGVENRNHHTLDVSYREDQSRVAQSNAAMPANTSGPKADQSVRPLPLTGWSATPLTDALSLISSLVTSPHEFPLPKSSFHPYPVLLS
jgi:hypothetical protein